MLQVKFWCSPFIEEEIDFQGEELPKVTHTQLGNGRDGNQTVRCMTPNPTFIRQ